MIFQIEANVRWTDVIAKRTLREFFTKHRDAEQALLAWHEEASVANWKSPVDIKGNNYRVVVRFNYPFGIVWKRFLRTHAAYDRINAETI